MKKIRFVLTIISCLYLQSQLLQAQGTVGFTTNGANNFLKEKCYVVLKQQVPFGSSYLLLSNMASDDAKAGGGASDGTTDLMGFEQFSIKTDNQLLNTIWIKRYEGISYCNQLIDYTTADASAEMDRFRAEAYFMRAFFYFDLVRLFGGVPLFLAANDPVKPELGRSTIEEVYAQIESDLLGAIPDLPNKLSLSADEKYRISKGAAQSLLGKVYLYEQKWQSAADQLSSVINSGQYNLLAKFSDLWVTSNKYNMESILEFPYSSIDATYDKGDYNYNSMLMGVRNIAGNPSVIKRGWGLCPATQDLVDAYLAEGDSVRLKSTIIDEDTLIKLGYSIDKTDVNSDYTGYYDFKHTALTADFQPGSMFSEKNEIVIRYADVMLMCAEAFFKLGNEMNAQMYLNIVRSRVNLPQVNAMGAALYEAIDKERRLELALEGNRFNDLIRWGQAESKLGGQGYTSKNNVWPIPESQIYLNPMLTQNVGYEYSGEAFTFAPSGYSPKYFDSYKIGLDSIMIFQYNFTAQDSLPYTLMTFHKKNNKIIDAKFSLYDITGEKWVMAGCAIDSLDESGRLLSETKYGYNHKKSTADVAFWDTVYQYKYTYNNNGFKTSDLQFRWNRMNIDGVYVNLWYPMLSNLLFPDNHGNDTLIVTLTYDLNTKTYKTFTKGRYEYTYGTAGLPDSTVYYQSGFNADTVNYTKSYYKANTYDSEQNFTQVDQYNWMGSAYELYSSQKYILEYNTSHAMTSNIYQSLNTESSLYDNLQKNVYCLDAGNRTVVLSNYSWHIGFEDWWIGDGKYRSFLYYNNSVDVKTITDEKLTLNIWPNPVTSDFINIEYKIMVTGFANLMIFSMDGKLVKNVSFQNLNTDENYTSIDVSDLSKGLYTLQLISGSSQEIRKLIIAR